MGNRRPERTGVVVAIAGLIALALVAGGGGRASADEASNVVTVGAVSDLNGVACPPDATATTTCYAVGDDLNGGGPDGFVVPVSASGGVGQPAPPSNVDFDAVACPTSSLCIAVGRGPDNTGFAVAVTAGQAGAAVALPIDPLSIDCPSSTECALGGSVAPGTPMEQPATTKVAVSGTTLVAGGAGTLPGRGSLEGLSCSSATSCLAVGSTGLDPVTEGAGQGTLATVDPGQNTPVADVTTLSAMISIAAIDCPTSGDCEAVGESASGHGALLPVSNGTVGTPTSLDNTSDLTALSCAGGPCEAVGINYPYRGTVQQAVAVPVIDGRPGPVRDVADEYYGLGVTCPTASACVAVGGTSNGEMNDLAGWVATVAPEGSAAPTPPADHCVGYLSGPVVGIAATSDGGGYWMTDAEGLVASCGDAVSGDDVGAPPARLAQPIVGIADGPDADGFYLVAADGDVFNYGKAAFHGSAGNLKLTTPVVGMAADPKGRGYWLVAADGGIFNYGDAPFDGSAA